MHLHDPFTSHYPSPDWINYLNPGVISGWGAGGYQRLQFKIRSLLDLLDLQSNDVIPSGTLERFFGHSGMNQIQTFGAQRDLSDLRNPPFPSLHDPLAAFAPPHHQGRHQQGDQDGHSDEGTQDAVGRVPEEAARQRAVVEVVPVHPDEELIHQPVGPEASHLQRHQEGAVRQLTVDSA